MPKKSDKYGLLQGELVSSDLVIERDRVYRVLQSAETYPEKFSENGFKNITTHKDLTFDDLNKWLSKASRDIYELTGRFLWTHKQSQNRFGITNTRYATEDKKRIEFNRDQDIEDALQLVEEVYRRSPDKQNKLGIRLTREPLAKKGKRSKRVKRSLEIGGVKAIELDVKKQENLSDPIVDVAFKVNNPVGRLWKAIKRMWKSQKTVIALKLTVPILILPIFLYALYRVWLGRGVNVPISKLGIIHEVTIEEGIQDILILPTSDAFVLSYGPDFDSSSRLLEAPVIVIGSFNQMNNRIILSEVIPYDQDVPTEGLDPAETNAAVDSLKSLWENTWDFFKYFK